MKKIMLLIIAFIFMFTPILSACGDKDEDKIERPNATLPNAPEGSLVKLASGTNAIVAGENRIDFVKKSDGYAVEMHNIKRLSDELKDGNQESLMFGNDKPVKINVRGASADLLGSYSQKDFTATYSDISKKAYGYALTGEITTSEGSRLVVFDDYYLIEADLVGINRSVKVKSVAGNDNGFASMIEFYNRDKSGDVNDFDFFIPSILYKNADKTVNGAIASNLDLDKVYVKETRTGLPMVMMYDHNSKDSLTITHYDPKIDVGGIVGGGKMGEVNEKLQYGSLGLSAIPQVGIGFTYPCAEGPTTYDLGAGWARKYHPMEKNFEQTYDVSLYLDSDKDYNESMTASYKKQFANVTTPIYEVDMGTVYDVNIDIFNGTYREFGSNFISAGVPWSLYLPEGTRGEGYSFQMGFVGQQTAVGYHMLRMGYMNNQTELIRRGKTVLNFWSSQQIMSNQLPIVWWDPDNAGGKKRNYPAFLRCFVDGMEGMLDGYRTSAKYGEPQTAWLNAVTKVADFLVSNQNDDGSYYRAYNENGTVCTDNSDNRFQGTSKLNTPIAIRFLAKMYEMYAESNPQKAEGYKTAALAAADFSYDELYVKLGKYVGGTPDNPNTVDKEAAVYAMYGFNAAYQLTGEDKYLKATQHAAACAMSWMYTYDFAVPTQSAEYAAASPFNDGNTSGFSVIATGHSGADNFVAYIFYELFKIYVLTGDSYYYDAALFVQNNSKQCTDWDGRLGYGYRAMMPEATNIADFSYLSAGGKGVWLPWASIANIEPIMNTYSAFGEMDISKLKDLGQQALKNRLDEYGLGGKILN